MSVSLRLAPHSDIKVQVVAPSEVLFVTEHSEWGELAYKTVSTAFNSVQPVFWSHGIPKPDLTNWRGDRIISFKADLILSRNTLDSAKKGAINFHPCPPRYRGLGGYWWALHNRDTTFGVTAHFMDERIDHGSIIDTKNFAIWPNDTEQSLKHRAAIHSLMLLSETLDTIVRGKEPVPCGVQWGQHLYTSKELERAKQAEQALETLGTIYDSLAGVKVETTHPDIYSPSVKLG